MSGADGRHPHRAERRPSRWPRCGRSDIYIKPDLDGIGAADFERGTPRPPSAAARAAEALAGALARLAVGRATSTRAWRRRLGDRRRATPRVDEIEIAGLAARQRRGGAPPHRAAGRRAAGHRRAQPRPAARLRRRLLRRRRLHAADASAAAACCASLPVEKRWGPDYLRLGAEPRHQRSARARPTTLRAGYQKTWLNRARRRAAGQRPRLGSQHRRWRSTGTSRWTPRSAASSSPAAGYRRARRRLRRRPAASPSTGCATSDVELPAGAEPRPARPGRASAGATATRRPERRHRRRRRCRRAR
ncbi:MAG: hypothetical protein MZW92_65175 [Comamonadaceae bacterium]|nr:hypothetical protein [Comamonadaceae bacterium]